MSSPVYPSAISNDSNISISEEENLRLITYNRSGPKSAEELLYEAASESNKRTAKLKWALFQQAVDDDSMTDKEVQKLIQDLDEQKQWSALHYAMAYNNYYVAKILIGKTFLRIYHRFRCNINILGGNGENILHVAAQSNKLWLKNEKSMTSDQTQVFDRENITLDHIVTNYNTPSSPEHFPAIITMLFDRYLFETDIDIDHEDDEGRTPLHLAIMNNRYSFVEYLLDKKAKLKATTKLNANIFHCMFFSSEPLQTETELQNMFKLLCEAARRKDNEYLLYSRTLDNRSPLAIAVCHPQCPQSILERLAENLNSNQLLLAFDLAAKRRIQKPALLKPLLPYFSPDAAVHRNILLQITCRHNHLEMLKWLRQEEHFNNYLTRKNDAGYTPLLTAVFYEAKECVQYLLRDMNSIEWKEQNGDGETVLHILANCEKSAEQEDDLELFQMIWQAMNFEGVNDVQMVKDNFGNLPLHCAARSNRLELCKQLLGITENISHSLSIIMMLNEKNALGQTAAHIASDMGHIDIIECFWKATGVEHPKDGLYKRDDERKTCLHLAAAKGHINIVKYLVGIVRLDVDSIADRRLTPLHLACQNGHSNVVTYLLEHEASPLLRDARLFNCLEIAITNFKDELVQNVLFNHSLWREMMRNAQPIKGTKAYDTPMRKLIRYMPKVTIYVIENKLTRIVGGSEQKVFRRTYDYEFYQDELFVEGWYTQGTVLDSAPQTCYARYKKLSWSETIRCAFCCFCCKDPNANKNDNTPYTDNSYTLVRNHPLFLVAQQSSCPELIQHPYNICLRKKKFYLFGIYLLLLSCLLYSTYLGIFTALVLQNRHPEYFYNLINVNYTEDLTTCEYVSRTLANGNNTEVFKPESHKTLRWVAFAFLILFIVKNTFLIISLFPKLLRMIGYYLEISVLVLSFVYILDWYDWLSPVLLRCPIQYQIGSFGLLLAWINFLAYVRYLPLARIGIYVVMIQVIFLKFLPFIPVLMIIICGFGFTYWMLLQNQSMYQTPTEALMRTGIMMFEINYDDRLYKSNEGGIGYYTILYVMFILSTIVLSIFVINLMISLAVGELPSLNDQSVTWRHQMMYDLLSDYEILRIQIRLLVDAITFGRFNKTKKRGPRLFKFLQRRQDVRIQRDENHVFFLLRFARYTQKHFFEERIQDNVQIPVENKKIKEAEKE